MGRFNNKLTAWTPDLIERLKKIGNEIVIDVDYWIDNILGGFITEFPIETSLSYSEAECKFLKGLRGKYQNSLKFWIRMLLCEKGVLWMRSD